MKGFIIFLVGVILLGYGMVATWSDFYDGIAAWFILWIMLFLIWPFVCYGYFSGKRKKKEAERVENLPLLTEAVTVISKLHEKEVDGMAGITETKNSYFVVFEFPDKSRQKFAVTLSQYGLVREGETGILSYKKLDDVSKMNLSVDLPASALASVIRQFILFVDFQPHS